MGEQKKKKKEKRMVIGEIVVIAFKPASTGEKRTRRRCVGRWPAALHNVVAGKRKLLERWDENIFDKLEGGEIMKDSSVCARARP